jgi:pyrophosphatase PpaX
MAPTSRELRMTMWICDVHGVLIDSTAVVRDAFAATAARYGFAFGDRRFDAIKGLWLLEAYRILDPGGDARARRDFHLAVVRERAADLQAFPGVRETLRAAKAAGVRIGAATSHGELAEACLVKTGLYECLECLVTQEEVRHPKPRPDAVLRVITLLGGRPRESGLTAVHIGDAAEDIEAGRAAGIRTIGVTFGVSREAEIRAAGPDDIIRRFTDLHAWLAPAESQTSCI